MSSPTYSGTYDLFLRIYDPKTGNYLLFMLELHLYIKFMHEKVWTYFFLDQSDLKISALVFSDHSHFGFIKTTFSGSI